MIEESSLSELWDEWKEQFEKKGDIKRNPKETTGELLKNLRQDRKMSVEQAAEKSGFSKGTISNYENGKTTPDLDDLRVLLFAYDVTIYDFFGIEKADYENDCNVFKRYGLSETFYRELFFAKEYGITNDIVSCINLIFEYPIYASALFKELAHFFNVSYHEQVDHISIKLPPDASMRLLNEPIFQTLESIFNAKYPERQKDAILSLLGQRAAGQVKVQKRLFEETQKHEKP